MEVPSVIRRCVWPALSKPASYRYLTSSTKVIPRQARRQIARTTTRAFTSTSRARRDAPPQPQPVSQEKNSTDAVGADPPRSSSSSIPQPDPNNRIDLSSLPGIPSSYVPPTQQTPPPPRPQREEPRSATAKLDALFKRPSRSSATYENRFERTIRQSDAMNSSSPSSSPQHLDITKLFEGFNISDRPAQAVNAEEKVALRLRPTLGRTQAVDHNRGVDLTRAFRLLDMKCVTNSVKKDANVQRFHIRRGQKRKLNRSFRWRVAFKAGFLEECARIRRMKNQGW